MDYVTYSKCNNTGNSTIKSVINIFSAIDEKIDIVKLIIMDIE
ncbi:hypothetical protein I4O84_005980 [Clostridioides difficile]